MAGGDGSAAVAGTTGEKKDGGAASKDATSATTSGAAAASGATGAGPTPVAAAAASSAVPPASSSSSQAKNTTAGPAAGAGPPAAAASAANPGAATAKAQGDGGGAAAAALTGQVPNPLAASASSAASSSASGSASGPAPAPASAAAGKSARPGRPANAPMGRARIRGPIPPRTTGSRAAAAGVAAAAAAAAPRMRRTKASLPGAAAAAGAASASAAVSAGRGNAGGAVGGGTSAAAAAAGGTGNGKKATVPSPLSPAPSPSSTPPPPSSSGNDINDGRSSSWARANHFKGRSGSVGAGGQEGAGGVAGGGASAAAAADRSTAACSAGSGNPLQSQRASLTSLYGPYIQSNDTSLEAARLRLRATLDQTRYLRALYTDRVYDRYKVNLLPVPEAVDDIVGAIRSDPEGTVARLTEEIRVIREEKDMEKRESAKLNAAAAEAAAAGGGRGRPRSISTPAAPSDGPTVVGASLVDATETADLLSWFGAGLNTVILPEAKVDEALVANYEVRGPTDPVTGQKVDGVTRSCAAAAEALLDRVRRATVLRSERKRRRLDVPTSGMLDGGAAPSGGGLMASMDGSFGDMSSSAHGLGGGFAAAGMATPSGAGRGRRRSKSGSGVGLAETVGRPAKSSSAAALLILDPSAEQISSKSKPTAAVAALHAAGVGDNAWIRGTPRHSLQMKRWRHPFPESRAGKKMTAVANSLQAGKKPAGVAASVASLFADPKIIMAPLDAKARKGVKPAQSLDRDMVAKPGAVVAARSVLGQFASTADAVGADSNPNDTTAAYDGGKRSISGIDMLVEAQARSSTDYSGLNGRAATNGNSNIDPVTTFSVLHGLGLMKSQNVDYGETRSPLTFLPTHLKGKRKFAEAFLDFAEESLTRDGEKVAPVQHIRGGGGSSDDDKDKARDGRGRSKSNGKSKRTAAKGKAKSASPPEQVSENDEAKSKSSKSTQSGGGDATNGSESNKKSAESTPTVGSTQISPSLLPALASLPPFTQQTLLQMQQAQAGGLGAGAGFMSSMLPAAMRQAGLEDYGSLQAAAAAAAVAGRAGGRPDLSDFFNSSLNAQRLASGLGLPSDWASMSLAAGNSGLSQQAIASLSAHDRAAREVLARENAAIVAAHARAQAQQAAAARGMASIGSLSQQQASSYMAGAAAAAAAGGMGAYANPASMASYAAYAGLSNAAGKAAAPKTDSKTKGVDEGKGDKEEVAEDDGKDKDVEEEAPVASSTTDEAVEEKSSTKSKDPKSSEANIDGNAKEEQVSAREEEAAVASKTASNPNAGEADSVKISDTQDGATSEEGSRPPSTKPEASAGTSGDNNDQDTAAMDVVVEEEEEEKQATKESEEKAKPVVTPKRLSPKVMTLIDEARFHEAISVYAKDSQEAPEDGNACERNDEKSQEASKESSSETNLTMLEYLLKAGDAVPIPNAVIVNILKERISFLLATVRDNKSVRSQLQASKDVVAAVVLIWLWNRYKTKLEEAMSNGRSLYDDSYCKWLLHATAHIAARALMVCPLPPIDGATLSSKALDARAAKLVSEALWKEFRIDNDMDNVIGKLGPLVKHLDHQRMEALKAKVHERTLLAALISRRTKMSEAFSHSYTSAVVRAGEALGHEDICDVAQDEAAKASTLMPYDFFDDELGAWEDPCRPSGGFIAGLTGDELIHRAHARAMLQKSMRRLQDRYAIKGGTLSAGPYADVVPKTDATGAAAAASLKSPSLSRSSSALKRKSSFSSIESGGGGSINALFRPAHYSAPLLWDCEDIDNLPYGRHTEINFTARGRSPSMARFGGFSISSSSLERPKKRRRSSGAEDDGSVTPMSVSPAPEDSTSGSLPEAADEDVANDPLPRSTVEIEWTHVADMFEPVELDDGSKKPQASPSPRASASAEKSIENVDKSSPSKKGPIIAPFCREFDYSKIDEDGSGESDDADGGEEEKLSDEAVLARHQAVLDDMKEKLEYAMKVRQSCIEKKSMQSPTERRPSNR